MSLAKLQRTNIGYKLTALKCLFLSAGASGLLGADALGALGSSAASHGRCSGMETDVDRIGRCRSCLEDCWFLLRSVRSEQGQVGVEQWYSGWALGRMSVC